VRRSLRTRKSCAFDGASSSLINAHRFDPVLNGSMQILLALDRERIRRDQCYNNVLDDWLDDDRRDDVKKWCECGSCGVQHHKSPRSMYCCMEGRNRSRYQNKFMEKFVPNANCLKENPHFQRLALDRTVLIASAKLLSQRYGTAVKENYSNGELRKAAYYNTANWIFGNMKRGDRRILPSCIVSAIRQVFPNPPGKRYVGFLAPYERAVAADDDSDFDADFTDDSQDEYNADTDDSD